MRLAVRSTLVLLAFYILILAGLAVVLLQELRSAEAALERETAWIIGREVAAAMTEPSLDRLLQADAESRREIRKIIQDVTGRSEAVTSISVVDHTGKVVASDDLEIGWPLRRPDQIFAPGDSARFFILSSEAFRGGSYVLAVPLRRAGQLVGFMRIAVNSDRIAALGRRIRNQMLLVGIIGLFAVGAVGYGLHHQLSRRGRELALAVEAALGGEDLSPARRDRDELAPVLDSAVRVARGRADERARELAGRHRLQALTEVMDVGVLIFRPDRTLDFANARAKQLLDCGDAEQLEECLKNLRSELEPVLGRLSPTLNAPVSLEVSVSRNGKPNPLRLELYMVSEEECEGYLGILQDRATLRALETDLRLATQLRSLSRVYGAAVHEILSPLGATMLNLELLNNALEGGEGVVPESRARLQRYGDVITRELQRMQRAFETLLKHTAPASDEPEEFDLRVLVEDVEALIRPHCRKQGIELTVQLPERTMIAAGNRGAIRQALINVVVNAIEALPEGGRIDLFLRPSREGATISVVDSGAGIPAELLDQVFRMHFTTKDTGSGVGLFIARSVIQSHGGEIRVRSEVGGGSQFDIELPVAKGKA